MNDILCLVMQAQRDGTLDAFLAPHLAEYWAKKREKANERYGNLSCSIFVAIKFFILDSFY
jgi:hypothetical protein